MKEAHDNQQTELAASRKREASLQVQLANASLENVELRREVGAGWQASEPSVLQVRQLVLDPAVSKEFQRQQRELEERSRQVMQLKEDLDGVQFTQESKMGRALIQKCRLLMEENEEMGRQLAEHREGAQDVLLGLEKEHAAELRRHIAELKSHCEILEEENEELQMAILVMRRAAADAQQIQQQQQCLRQLVPQHPHPPQLPMHLHHQQ